MAILNSMSKKSGQLLWHRMRILIPSLIPEGGLDIDTGLTQISKSFDASSADEPPLGIPGTSAPFPGSEPASRVQVIPLAPLNAWFGVYHSEPYFNTTTNTVHVTFYSSGGERVDATINALFWDPHTGIGPGEADTYNPQIS